MNIFILNIDDFDSKLLKNLVKADADSLKYKSELKRNQHVLGRFLLKFAAEKFYNVEDASVYYIEEKPIFKNSSLYFSISHSKNIVAVVICGNKVGIDVEYNQRIRDFVAITERYDTNLSNKMKNMDIDSQRKEFYEFWTKTEAKIKLNTNKKAYFTTVYPVDKFTMSIASEEPFSIDKIINYSDIPIIW